MKGKFGAKMNLAAFWFASSKIGSAGAVAEAENAGGVGLSLDGPPEE